MKPTTEKIRGKEYVCGSCGHKKVINTNHYGECYSFGNWNRCPKCPPMNLPTVWVCTESPPEHMDKPEPWKIVKLGDVATIVRADGDIGEKEVVDDSAE